VTRRVLVARLDNAGDVLLAGPAVRAVAASGARVTFLAGPHGEAAARLLPGVDEVATLRAPWILEHAAAFDRSELERFAAWAEEQEFAEALVLVSFHQSPLPLALLLRTAGVGRIAAVSTDHPGALLDHRVEDRPELHEVEQALRVAAALGHHLPAGDQGELRVVETGPQPVLGDLPPRFTVVHPCASVPTRSLPDHVVVPAIELLATAGHAVVVTGGPRDGAVPIGPVAADLRGRTSLAELAAVLRAADALVVGNTGPAHLAAAVGTPVVEVFAPVVPAERWRPWMVPHVLLGDARIGCAGCRARICPIAGQPCTAQITASDVAGAVDQLIARRTEVAVA
jgi:ADP-heptose:LPS heptosyltransferase